MELIAKFHAKTTLQVEDIEETVNLIGIITKEKLNSSISNNGKLYELESRKVFLSIMNNDDPLEREIPIITNGKVEEKILLSGDFFTHTVTDMWYITLQIRKKITIKATLNLFRQMCGLVNCYWSKISLAPAERYFFDQGQPDYNPTSTVALPKLALAPPYDTPYIPSRLGWLNYWPAPTLKRVNFQEEHRALFHSVQPAANDGLILQITEEPLDLDNAEHLRKTVAIYDALPAVGGRDCV